jgi:hypothetical protein
MVLPDSDQAVLDGLGMGRVEGRGQGAGTRTTRTRTRSARRRTCRGRRRQRTWPSTTIRATGGSAMRRCSGGVWHSNESGIAYYVRGPGTEGKSNDLASAVSILTSHQPHVQALLKVGLFATWLCVPARHKLAYRWITHIFIFFHVYSPALSQSDTRTIL